MPDQTAAENQLLLTISDEVRIFDNSSTRPVQIFVKSSENEYYLLNREQRHGFFDKYIAENDIKILHDFSCGETDMLFDNVME